MSDTKFFCRACGATQIIDPIYVITEDPVVPPCHCGAVDWSSTRTRPKPLDQTEDDCLYAVIYRRGVTLQGSGHLERQIIDKAIADLRELDDDEIAENLTVDPLGDRFFRVTITEES